uniref:Protein SUPPRESSOR OF GENE SILENCING 3 n=1 Tax=Anthurium amnicola TaxID=1678845 RepID=A0A1D1YUE9_9ARAE
MDYSSEESSEVSDSDIDDYESNSYLELKSGKQVVRKPSGTYRCPFCIRKKKQDYHYRDILRHAYSLGASNQNVKVKANHRAFAKYLTTDMADGADQLSQPVVANPELPPKPKEDDQFVWPWMGILVNVPTEIKDGRCFGRSGMALKQQLSEYNPLKINPLWNFKGHTGSAIVDFNKDWSGFKDAMTFEKHFVKEHFGRNNWYEKKPHKYGIHGWLARAEDYNLGGPIGKYLRNNGDLKTVANHVKEESEKNQKLVADLTNRVQVANMHLREMECRYNESTFSLNQMMEQRDRLHHAYNEEMRKMQNFARDQSHHILKENEDLRVQLESKKKELDSQCKVVRKLRNLLMRRKRMQRKTMRFHWQYWNQKRQMKTVCGRLKNRKRHP